MSDHETLHPLVSGNNFFEFGHESSDLRPLEIKKKTRSLKNLKPRFSNSFSLTKTLRNI